MSTYVAWIQPLVQAVATHQQGKDQARIAQMNAQILRQASRDELNVAARDEEALRREARMRIGRQQAAQAEAGIGTTGSAGLLLEQSSILAELDALNIRYGGELRSKGLLAQSGALSARGRSVRRNTGLLAGAQLLTGWSDAYTKSRTGGG